MDTAKLVSSDANLQSSTSWGYKVGSPPPNPTPMHPFMSNSLSHLVTFLKESVIGFFDAKQWEHDKSQIFVNAIETCRGELDHVLQGNETSSNKIFKPVFLLKKCNPDGVLRYFILESFSLIFYFPFL